MDYAQNTFNGGMVLDFHESNTPENVLTNALNATLISFNGNEQVLLNDMGNARIKYKTLDGCEEFAHLPLGFIPIGAKVFGRIMYIVSYNPKTGEGEIGSFPSPDYDCYNSEGKRVTEGSLVYKYDALRVGCMDDETDSNSDTYPMRSRYFNFDLQHPVELNVDTTYDGSVDLIFTDNKNKPRLINTGFSLHDNNTYLIINRYGHNNTNRYPLYDETAFDIKTSLYTDTSEICNFIYKGLNNTGKLGVGNYVFYAIACDKDGNESDIIAESGVVPVFIGTDGDPFSINGGTENQATDKAVIFQMSGCDNIPYIKICYTKSSSANNENLVTSVYKITDPFYVDGTDIIITGYEASTLIAISDLNTLYFNADRVKSLAIVSNMLFQANLTEENQSYDEYEKLREYSLTIIPHVCTDISVNMKSDYKADKENNNSYYDSQFTYNTTGYHAGEIYRFGIVYIRADNSFTSVFDVLGVNKLSLSIKTLTQYPKNEQLDNSLPYYLPGFGFSSTMTKDNISYNYNIKGVCRIDEDVLDDMMQVIGIRFKFTQKMPDSEKYKGFFFVRQKRIPTLITQGYTTNICEEAFLPSLNVENDGHVYHNYESFQTCGFRYYVSSWKKDYPNFFPRRSGGMGYLINGYDQRLFSLPETTLAFFDKVDDNNKRAIYQYYVNQLNQDETMLSNHIVDQWPEKKVGVSLYQFQGDDTKNYYMIALTGLSTKGKHEYRIGAAFLSEIEDEDTITKTNWVTLGNTTDIEDFPTSSFAFTDGKENIIHAGFLRFYNNSTTIQNITYHIKGQLGIWSLPWYTALALSVASSAWSDKLSRFGCGYSNKDGLWINYYDDSGNETTIARLAIHEDIDSKNDTYYYFFENDPGDDETTDQDVTDEAAPKLAYIRFWDNKITMYVKGKINGVYYNVDYTFSLSGSINYKFDAEHNKTFTKSATGVRSTSSQPPSPYASLRVIIDGTAYEFLDFIESDDSVYHSYEAKENFVKKISERVLRNYDARGGLYLDDTDDPGYDFDVSTYNGKYDYPSKKESANYANMAYYFNPLEVNSYAMFCPDFELDMPYYNNIFTGQELTCQVLTDTQYLNKEALRLYTYDNTALKKDKSIIGTHCLSIEEGMSLGTILHKKSVRGKRQVKRDDNVFFSAKAADGTDKSFVFAGCKFLAQTMPNESYPGYKSTDKDAKTTDYSYKSGRLSMQKPFNIVRGLYGSYVGMYPYVEHGDDYSGADIANKIVNIYIPNYSKDNLGDYFQTRFNDRALYYRISDSISLGESQEIECYRGDCFIGWYTHRVNRNFNDDSAPYNDMILQGSCFTKALDKLFSIEYRNFDLTRNEETALNINTGDLNAVQLGSWVTFPCRSSRNISIRSTNEAWTDEKAHSGNARSFYPLHSIDPSGAYKLRESDNYNEGFSKSGGERYHFNQNNYIWNNNYYKNRVLYSNIKVNGAFENGNRVFLATHHRDYTNQYGQITKILPISTDLIVICEHGTLVIPVNERALAGEGQGGMVYINTSNVLPETPNVLSEDFGTTWPDSIINTPYGIFGVDSCAKKIWMTNGGRLLVISDTKIETFLNKALTMDGASVDIGLVNIVGHYNAYKSDIMFTAYQYGIENVLWNICYNLLTQSWSTFYSWIPSISGNIGNAFISFDHQIDRHILDLSSSANHDVGYHNTTHYLWKHGLSEFVGETEKIKPTFWYGSQHPFEFEFVVKKEASVHKIFNDLRLLANKAKPESFHFEVVGECYDLANDKPNMYYRQELTKALFRECLGSNIKYNKNFLDIKPVILTNLGSGTLKSTYFPLYYRRIADRNDIEDYYQRLFAEGYDYQNLSGSEIIYNELLNEFRIWCHVKGVDMKQFGRLRGNMHYKEDGWYILIPSITYQLKNEYLNKGYDGKPILNLSHVPDDITPTSFDLDVLNDKFNLNYTYQDLDFNDWGNRREMRLKDKYIKIRIRYTGDELALIGGVLTMFTVSLS